MSSYGREKESFGVSLYKDTDPSEQELTLRVNLTLVTSLLQMQPQWGLRLQHMTFSRTHTLNSSKVIVILVLPWQQLLSYANFQSPADDR